MEEGTRAYEAYKQKKIRERHRHRFEVSNTFRNQLSTRGLVLSGFCREERVTAKYGDLVEMIELAGHPYFVGCQFHPEFRSKPLAPHPLFKNFIGYALKFQEARKGK